MGFALIRRYFAAGVAMLRAVGMWHRGDTGPKATHSADFAVEADTDLTTAALFHFGKLHASTWPRTDRHPEFLQYIPLSFTAWEAGEPIGGTYGYLIYDFGVVEVVWVAAAHRHRGLGEVLLGRIEERARQAGCRRLLLTTLSLHDAFGFWKKQGFRTIATLDDCPKNGTLYYLEKRLSTPAP
jgi:GNAT superfamily N-acetyltransferase